MRELPDQLAIPLAWRKPRRIFVNSLSDLFQRGVSFDFIAAVFGVMAACPQHTFQVLTKRADRMREFIAWVEKRGQDGLSMFPDDSLAWRIGQFLAVTARQVGGVDGYRKGTRATGYRDVDPRRQPWPLPNVWLGVSVEDQARAKERIPELLKTPAAVRFLSCEPLVEEVDLEPWLPAMDECAGCGHLQHRLDGDACVACHDERDEAGFYMRELQWVIVGGESGPFARPLHLAWIRSVVTQCRARHVPVFVKQLGDHPVDDGQRVAIRSRKGGHPLDLPEDLRVWEYPGPEDRLRALDTENGIGGDHA